MNQNNKLIAFFVLISLTLFSCATMPYHELPTYSPDQEMYLYKDVKIKIGKTYWADTVGYQKAAANFLVIELSITNIGKKTIKITHPSFTVVNEQGYEYELSAATAGPNEDLMGNIFNAAIGGRLYPLMPARGYIIFDVPKGNYFLIVSTGEQNMKTAEVLRIKDLFKYKLTPVDK